MAGVETFVRDYRTAVTELIDQLEKIEAMKKQAVILDYATTLPGEFQTNEDLISQNPDIAAADLIAATQAVDAIWTMLEATDYQQAKRLYKVRL